MIALLISTAIILALALVVGSAWAWAIDRDADNPRWVAQRECDDVDIAQTADEAERELRAAGVDVDGFLAEARRRRAEYERVQAAQERSE